jgi:serine/threonine protein kinase
MATVFLARHGALGNLVAIKVHTSTKPSIKGRFAREGRLQARLHHPNIVAVTDVLEMGDHAGLVMELVDGPSLSAFLRRYRPPVEDGVALFRGLAAGLAQAHDQGLIHRDLKPSNVLLAVDDHRVLAKLTDFGLAKSLIDIEEIRTRTGATLGTPSYMPPEQMRDASKVDHRADIYGLGCLLYTIVTGRPPHRGSDIFELLERIENRRYLDPLATPGVTPKLAELLHALLSPEPGDRPQQVTDALRALGELGTAPLTPQTVTVARALQEENRQKLAIAEANTRDPDRSLEVSSLPTRERGPPPRTLVVSPDSEARKRIRRALKPYNIQPDQVPDGARALGLLLESERERQPFALVIIDDGARSGLLEARIARDPRLAGCRVIRADAMPGGTTELARLLGHVLQGTEPVHERTTRPASIVPMPRVDARRVLVFAPGLAARTLAAHLVRQCGLEALEAASLDEAVALVAQDPAMILVDVGSAELVDAVVAIRGAGCLAPAVVVANEVTTAMRALGVIHALAPPLTSQAVRAAFARLEPRGRPRAAILDPVVLTRLRNDVGGDDALRSVIAVFLQRVDEEVAALYAAQTERAALAQTVQRLHASALQLGAGALAEACESLLRGGGEVGPKIDEIVENLQRTSSVLHGWIQRGARRAG